MKNTDYVIFFFTGLLAAIVWALFQNVPGYMDAEYYYANAIQLFRNEGLQEPFIWNYLSSPVGLPATAFSYWMPLPSLLAAAGMFIFQNESFMAGRSLFLLFAGLLPVMVRILAKRLFADNKFIWTAGILAIFSGYYTIFISQTDSFVVLMVLACIYFLIAFSIPLIAQTKWNWTLGLFSLGLLSGLIHLLRADGLLWLLGSAGIMIWRIVLFKQNQTLSGCKETLALVLLGAAAILGGYLFVTGWWYARNISVWGTWMPPGGIATIWLTSYDQTFVFPADQLNFQNWLASGWHSIIKARIESLFQNLKTLIGVQLMVFLLPFVLAGAWKFKKQPVFRFSFFMWLAIFSAMTLVFPFAGARGGYFHSGSAIQPIIWALFPVGFQSFIDFGVKKRNWNAKVAGRVLASGFMLIAVSLSVALFFGRVSGTTGGQNWNQSNEQYLRIGNKLTELGISNSAIIMVNNPPGFYLATGRPSIVIPDGGVETLLLASQEFGAEYIVLEQNHPEKLDEVFIYPKINKDLEFVAEINGAFLFRLPVK